MSDSGLIAGVDLAAGSDFSVFWCMGCKSDSCEHANTAKVDANWNGVIADGNLVVR